MSVVTRGDQGSIREAGRTEDLGRTGGADPTGEVEATGGAEADPTETEGTFNIFQEKVHFQRKEKKIPLFQQKQ